MMAAYDPEKITFFAKTDARGQQVQFGIKAKDRQRHMYVIGKTGMGKSTLLENMAAQDIQSGEGMAFIDPHGSAIETLLDYVPEDRLDDVVYFAPFDMENPIAFNIMEDVGIDKRHLVVSGLMSTFKKIWVDAWSARMEYILTNALLALIEYPDTTLLSVNRMLADKAYRDEVVVNVKDPAVKAYWVDEFASYTERFAAEALPAIQNKIGQFTGNPLIRNIIGQPHSSFDVRKMMDEKKILLINLSKGLIGETNADLIGSMLITKIYLAAMSRAELPPAQMKQMPNFYFYVDEFQSFANATFANILSEARKYHLNLIIAHQYIQQMEEEIRDAVFGNVGTTISFRVGPFDAEVLETVFAPEFEATDLVNLGFAQIYLSLMIDGVGSRPFSAVTLPPVPTPSKSCRNMAIKRSQQNYCRARAEVEQAVIDSHAPAKRIADAVDTGGGNKGSFTKPSDCHRVGTDKKSQVKRGNQNTNNSRSGSDTEGQSKVNYHQTKPPSKTAADLKDILAGMTSQNNQPKSELQTDIASETEVSKTYSTPTKQPQPISKEEEKERPAPPPMPTVTPVARPDRSTKQTNLAKPAADDLRAVLARLAQKVNIPSPKLNNTAASQLNQLDQAIDQQSPTTPKYIQPSSPARMVNKQQPQRTSTPSAVNRLVRPDHQVRPAATLYNQPLKDLKTTLAQVVAITPPAANQEVITPSDDPLATSYKQSPEPSIGGVRQPAYTPHTHSTEPDINIAKKILRHSGKERPPGT